MRTDARQTLVAMASGDKSGGVGYDQILESWEREAAERQKRAEVAFRELCERVKLSVSSDPSTFLPSAEWGMETSEEPAWLAEHGRTADLVVGRAREGESVAMGVLEACLMETGRPVLIVPSKIPTVRYR